MLTQHVVLEQIEISNHILKMTQQYELLTYKAEEMIQLSKERKTALISAAVTGKIDVRDWKPKSSIRDTA